MASYFGINGDTTSFFSGYFGTTGSTDSSSSSALGDYAMIRSGAYKKLLNAYYGKNTATDSSSQTEDSEETKQVKTDLTQTKSAATDLHKAANTLKNTDSSDKDRLLENVKSFINAYNETIDTADDVDTSSVLHKTLWMIGNTESSKNLLKEVGITVGADNKLTLSEDTFKEADASTLKTLFSGANSFADKISGKAADIANLSANVLQSLSGSKSGYTSAGNYTSLNTSKLYDSLF